MSEFYFDVGKWEEDLSRRGRKLMAEEGDPAGEEGTRRGNERDQVKRIWYVFCAYSFSSLWHLKNPFFLLVGSV